MVAIAKTTQCNLLGDTSEIRLRETQISINVTVRHFAGAKVV